MHLNSCCYYKEWKGQNQQKLDQGSPGLSKAFQTDKTFEADVALGDVLGVVDLALVEAGVLAPRLQDRQGAVPQDTLLHGELPHLLLHWFNG